MTKVWASEEECRNKEIDRVIMDAESYNGADQLVLKGTQALAVDAEGQSSYSIIDR